MSDRQDIRLVTSASAAHEVVFFMSPEGGGEAIVTVPGKKPARIWIDPPEEGWRIVITRVRGFTEIVYRKIDG